MDDLGEESIWISADCDYLTIHIGDEDRRQIILTHREAEKLSLSLRNFVNQEDE